MIGSLAPCLHAALALEHQIGPRLDGPAAGGRTFSNSLRHNSEPAVLVCGAVRVEINDFAVAEADTESFFNKHIAIFFLGKCRLAAATISRTGLFLKQR